ncbi:DNA internalization-related competence protein ComEC/Rec2 [Staphylococcus pseudintermedius]|uniref:DNA internalization-related competence protein ComEC/Rec2 n=1 Tax=Staphylococcus pseudintermedius TaxID=283734 RepID=A0A8H9BVU3_STAPS|nr:DNA internalization-related competence protein ComEC/Rec2 [Staphylococcus pseudintermedius]ASQ50485.1 competence protein ComEC [Staphylococcus pseudintermedius]EGQ0382978.1 DNA internalization-related competence protein ComEC/Rec2 [Staphylococcus pseudintermedius]EGQ1283652.1 DNA internalization-related competence protein ComEC/Rec2 [Staphylococcus pseudintermedius]EGQ1317409.1 DNA internalization-related competence protein ComEC/Rec2 [Staphylococcus pseudintermedius]EGQ2741330.1 DNA intern
MTYWLITYIIGNIAHHHLLTACFIYSVLACSLYLKKMSWLFIISTLIVVLIGYTIETIQHKNEPSILTATPTSSHKTISVHLTTLPIVTDQLLTVQATFNKQEILIKGRIKPQQFIPDAHFLLNHQCQLTGSFQPPLYRQQRPLFAVKKITFDQCHMTTPTLKQRITYVRSVVTERLLNSQLFGRGELIAIATGNANYLDKDMKSLAQQLGISHLFAVSGTHVSIFIFMFYAIGKRLPLPMYYTEVGLILFLPVFLIFVGTSPSATRAVAMTLLLLIVSRYFHMTSLQSLLLVYFVMSLMNSDYHYHLGFLYSFLISGILILMKDIFTERPIYQSLFLGSYIAVIAAIPLNYVQLNEIQWQGLISNLFFIPLYSIIIIPLSFILAIIAIVTPAFLSMFTHFTHVIFDIQAFLLKRLTVLERFTLPIPDFGEFGFLCCTIATFILLYLLSQRRYIISIVLVCCLCILLWQVHPRFTNQMTMIDVGQGDAILFQSQTGETLMIDTGGAYEHHQRKQSNINITKKNIYPLFKKLGIHQIDYLVITHAHQDHMGEIEHLSQYVNIKNVVINPSHFDDEKFQKVQHVIASEHAQLYSYEDLSRIVLGDFQFQFFNTDIPESEDPNEHSIVTLATIHDIHVLLMGDATTKNEDVLLKQYSLPRIQILKVGHHGSRTSSSKTFLSQIHPDIALISAGKQNMYHLPHPLTLQKLHDIHAKIYNTADNHHIHVRFDAFNEAGYTLRTEPLN